MNYSSALVCINISTVEASFDLTVFWSILTSHRRVIDWIPWISNFASWRARVPIKIVCCFFRVAYKFEPSNKTFADGGGKKMMREINGNQGWTLSDGILTILSLDDCQNRSFDKMILTFLPQHGEWSDADSLSLSLSPINPVRGFRDGERTKKTVSPSWGPSSRPVYSRQDCLMETNETWRFEANMSVRQLLPLLRLCCFREEKTTARSSLVISDSNFSLWPKYNN